MDILIQASQLILSLSILIVLHELGHFLPARYFKTRVEKFYLFFDPWFSLFKVKKGDTEYGIGWLPLGGYVKISGMIDESMDKEALAKEPEPWEFRSKPAWQRLIIMLGGVTVNLLLGYFIYTMILFAWGKEYLPNENAVLGVQCDSLLLANGLMNGDKILEVEGEKPLTLGFVNTAILIDDARNLTIERKGKQIQVVLPEDISEQILDRGVKEPLTERIPFVIDTMVPEMGAGQSDLRENDQIVGIDGKVLPGFYDCREELQNKKGQTVTLQVIRKKQRLNIRVDVDKEGKIGAWPKSPSAYFETVKLEYTLIEAIPAGFTETINRLTMYVKSMKLIFTPAGAKQMGGFGAIGSMFSARWDWQHFWNLTAFISIILAFMNILPIPALDGGHVMFLLYEMAAGRKPPDRFMEYAQLAGMILLIGLVLYANGMDIFRAFTS